MAADLPFGVAATHGPPRRTSAAAEVREIRDYWKDRAYQYRQQNRYAHKVTEFETKVEAAEFILNALIRGGYD